MSQQERENQLTGLEIAVIGMAGRFPAAGGIDEFWDNLLEARECISWFSDEELREEGVPGEMLTDPRYIRAYGWLAGIHRFDASFFDYTPLEVEIMDPQVRVFHECAYAALEDAGYDSSRFKRPIGLYAGASASFYWQLQAEFSGKNEILGWFGSKLLNDKDFLGTRLAYKLNLKGPALTLDTACSTSLVAIHLACQGLLCGDSDMALAGGVTIALLTKEGYWYREGMINSSDGHCRAFAARANGSNFGNAAAVVVLKRLENALADGDTIHAVIKGSAVNNDGSRKAAYTAPAFEGQATTIRTALQMAEVSPETIGYIETHGTGTSLGDPVEIEGLKAAFNTSKKQFCAIGAVKANVGHLEMAAGVTGFIKTVLSLKHRLIPPSLFFDAPNPKIDFENSPFYVNTRVRDWKQEKDNINIPRRAGVSSFGIGGTNAHVVLEEAPPPVSGESKKAGEYRLITLSAKTPTALENMTRNLVRHFKTHPGIDLADAAYTLQVGRQLLPHRRLLACREAEEAAALLSTPGSGRVRTVSAREDNCPVVFMFPGLGSQYVNMGRDLYEGEPRFRQEMDRCVEILRPLTDLNIKALLYPAVDNRSDRSEKSDNSDLSDFEVAQLAVFMFEYSLAMVLMHWGIKPRALIGYSFGEYAAACLAGVFSLEDGLKLVAARGKLIRDLPAGAMLSVPLTPGELAPILADCPGLAIAIDNGPSCIAAGSPEAVHLLAGQMKKRKILCMPVASSHALHSPMMAPALEKLTEIAATLKLNEARIPLVSNVSGGWLTGPEAVDPGYWARHLSRTVRFAEGMKKLLEDTTRTFVEIGPGRDLTTLAVRHFESEQNSKHQALNLVRQPGRQVSDLYYLSDKIGRLWSLGQPVDWRAFSAGEKRKRIPLPTYPFDGQDFPVDFKSLRAGGKSGSLPLSGGSRLQKKADIADWFYAPQWTRTVLPAGPVRERASRTCSLFFSPGAGWAARWREQWRQPGHIIITVEAGQGFQQVGEREYRVNPQRAADYDALLGALDKTGELPGHIVHLWNVTAADPNPPAAAGSDMDLYRGFYSLIWLARAIGQHKWGHEIRLEVISNHLHEVRGDEWLCPSKATLLGAVRVIPQEYPQIRCRGIDIELPGEGPRQERAFFHELEKELAASTPEAVVAYRNNYRWVQTFAPVRLETPPDPVPRLRKAGVYLITGGLGNLGFSFSAYLVKQLGAKLILTGRTSLPAETQWEQWLSSHGPDDPLSRKIMKVKQLREMGGQVKVFAADAAEKQQVLEVLRQAEEQWGPIHGVIHAAGDTGAIISPIQHLSQAHCQRHFGAKIQGLHVLGELFRDKEPDFCLLISSLSPLLGGLGFAAYSAANAYMDAYVYRYNRGRSLKWTSVNWGDWQFEKASAPNRSSLSLLEMTPAEGIETFKRILSYWDSHQVVVSSGDLQTRINQWVHLESFREQGDDDRKEAGQRVVHQRPDLLNPYVAPRSRLEQDIAAAWEKLFGFERVGVQDDFFELGGDSLKAITAISRLHKNLEVLVSLPEFFKRATIEELAKYIAASRKVRYVSVQPAEKKDYYVLSPAQQRLYILQQMKRDTIAYNESQAVIRPGAPDREKIAAAFRSLIHRHESLRTSFALVAGQPVQRIHDKIDFEVEYYDPGSKALGSEGKPGPGTVLENFLRPFDLAQAPLLRVGLLELGENRHLLMVDLHHIITDGTSNQLLMKEYTALTRGEELPGLRVHYKEYAEWRQREKQGASAAAQEAHWLERFNGELPLLDLPLDHERPAELTFAGRSLGFEIHRQEALALRNLLPKEDATLYMKLLAAFYILLFKLSGQEDIIVGAPTAGRRHADLENIIGMFVNTLPLRNWPAADRTFAGFLREVKERTLKDFENQDYPFEELIDRLKVDRDTSRNPLFDTAFILQSAAAGEASPNPYKYENNISKFDLTLQGFESGERLAFTMEYSAGLFKEETIRRFSGYFRGIISSVIEDPHRELGEIEILSPEEKQQVLGAFNDTYVSLPHPLLLHGLFREQAAKTPDQVVLSGEVQVSYGELQARAGGLAVVLQERGVGFDTVVGLMVERSVAMIVGILGILKAGGAYMPIDPEYPPDRVRFMLTDSNAAILVKRGGFFNDSSGIKGMDTVSIDDPPALLNSSAGRHIHPSSVITHHSFNLAYLIYTSGTTGRPKGVMVEHGSIVNTLLCRREEYGMGVGVTALQLFSFSFDGFLTSFFTPVISGARVVLMTAQGLRELEKIKAAIVKHRVTHMICVPTLYRVIIDSLSSGEAGGLKLVTLAGEPVSPGVITATTLKNKTLEISNEYGVTEASVMSTIFRHQEQESTISVGKPVWNHRVYILDKRACLQPVGVWGELCIGGRGVARGYLNNPELTFERFIQDENNQTFFRGGPGGAVFSKSAPPGRRRQKLYKTGDLARWLVDGNIEFLGRADQQVKIRGFRIELGEIENRLRSHHQVDNVVVVAGEKAGNRYLCAYYVPAGPGVEAPALGEYLAGVLPGYMIPAYFIKMDVIPVTSSGKVDRRALPEPGAQLAGDYVEPGTLLEITIAGIWKEVLGLDKIGVHQRFFDMGGNSVNILQVHSKLKEALKKDLPMMAVFRYPSISAFAAYLDEQGQGEASRAVQSGRLAADKTMMKQTLRKLGRG